MLNDHYTENSYEAIPSTPELVRSELRPLGSILVSSDRLCSRDRMAIHQCSAMFYVANQAASPDRAQYFGRSLPNIRSLSIDPRTPTHVAAICWGISRRILVIATVTIFFYSGRQYWSIMDELFLRSETVSTEDVIIRSIPLLLLLMIKLMYT